MLFSVQTKHFKKNHTSGKGQKYSFVSWVFKEMKFVILLFSNIKMTKIFFNHFILSLGAHP